MADKEWVNLKGDGSIETSVGVIPNTLRLAVELYVHQENQRLLRWIDDLQSQMYVNCVYCGHRYGPEADTPVAMAEMLKQHIEQCLQHPMRQLKTQNVTLLYLLEAAYAALRSYQYGNSSTELAAAMADHISPFLGPDSLAAKLQRETPWVSSAHLPGYEQRRNSQGHLETRPKEGS